MLHLRIGKKRAIIIFGLLIIVAASVAALLYWTSNPNKIGKPLTSDNPSIDDLAGNTLVTDKQKAEYVEAKASKAIQDKKLDEAQGYINELSNKYKYKDSNLTLMILKAQLLMRKGEFQQSVVMIEKIIQDPSIKDDKEAQKNWNEFLSYAKAGRDAYVQVKSDQEDR